jgi:hypothetical protein
MRRSEPGQTSLVWQPQGSPNMLVIIIASGKQNVKLFMAGLICKPPKAQLQSLS